MNCILKELNVRPRAEALREENRHDRAVVDGRYAVLCNGHNVVPFKRPICGMFRLLFFFQRPPHLNRHELGNLTSPETTGTYRVTRVRITCGHKQYYVRLRL